MSTVRQNYANGNVDVTVNIHKTLQLANHV